MVKKSAGDYSESVTWKDGMWSGKRRAEQVLGRFGVKISPKSLLGISGQGTGKKALI